MIGTIRKHSAWLWVFIITLTIISFVWWGASPATRHGAGSAGSFGTLYGHEVTQEDYIHARAEYFIWFWLRNHQWPTENARLTQTEMNREIYWRLMFKRQADQLGIHVGEAEAARMANQWLVSLSRSSRQQVTMDQLVAVLQQQKFTVTDLENTLADDIATEQLVQIKGMSGALITPQEVSEAFDHDYQQFSSEAVFFEASNYISQVTVSPAAVAQFYTNYLAVYREPDRIQISYVFFGISNYLAQAKAEWMKTNFEDVVTEVYTERAADFADEKTPEAAKAKIRDLLVRQRAAGEALKAAREFAGPVFNDGKPESLATFARTANLPVHTTLPFSVQEGPSEFEAPAAFVKEAFRLDNDTPLAGPLQTADGFYVIALAGKVPSYIPSFAQIRDRVVADYEEQQSVALAQRAGTNFYYQAAVSSTAGKSFAQTAKALGYRVRTIPAFALSTEEQAEIGDQNTLEAFKQVAVSTPPGRFSNFEPTATGGFILHVKALVPVDAAKKAQELPEFAEQLRRERVSTAFNLWLGAESYREFRNVPLLQQPANGQAAQAQ